MMVWKCASRWGALGWGSGGKSSRVCCGAGVLLDLAPLCTVIAVRGWDMEGEETWEGVGVGVVAVVDCGFPP